MKASKNFATPNGTSHDPANMKHVTAQVTGVDVPLSDAHIVTLHLEQRRSTSDYVLKLRLSVREAEKLAEALLKGASQCGLWEVM